MSRRAILIGCGDYPFALLGAPVKDARDLRKKLIACGIFDEEETALLIDDGSPRADGEAEPDGAATRENILAALRPLLKDEDCTRFLFYFAGHGISYRSGKADPDLAAAILCHGVRDVAEDGDQMLNMDELLGHFRLRGPQEQLWIIDACRDMPEGSEVTNIPSTGWPSGEAGSERRRSALYAVAPLGKAKEVQGANGVFTSHLLKALDGAGRAAVWDEGKQQWMVTLRSACEYARARMAPGLADWQKKYLLPRIEAETMEPPEPLRLLSDELAPKDRPLTLTIRPAEAAEHVSAELMLQRRTEARWPPLPQSPPVQPSVYSLRVDALSPWVTVKQEPEAPIDTREVEEIILTLEARGPQPALAGVPLDSPTGPRAPAHGRIARIGFRDEGTRLGFRKDGTPDSRPSITVHAADPSLVFLFTRHGAAGAPVVRQFAPYKYEGSWEFEPGAWRVEAMFGDELVGAAEVDLLAGTHTDLEVEAALPAALRDAHWSSEAEIPERDGTIYAAVSETVGPIQGGFLQSVLPLLALRPFDRGGALTKLDTLGLERGVLAGEAEDSAWKLPIGVAVALDGDWTGLAPPRLTEATLALNWASREGWAEWQEKDEVRVLATTFQTVGRWDDAPRPRETNLLTVIVPGWGNLSLAVPRVAGRIACIGAVLKPGGDFDLSVTSLRPDESDEASRGQASRAVAVTAQWMESRRKGVMPDSNLLEVAAYGKWNDPVLGALAWFGWELMPAERRVPEWARIDIPLNMMTAFHDLVDAQVLLEQVTRDGSFNATTERAADWAAVGDAIRSALLDDGAFIARALEKGVDFINLVTERRKRKDWLFHNIPPIAPSDRGPVLASQYDQPVLAASIDAIARLALERGLTDHWSVRRRAALDPRAVWNAVHRPETGEK